MASLSPALRSIFFLSAMICTMVSWSGAAEATLPGSLGISCSAPGSSWSGAAGVSTGSLHAGKPGL
eukprot:6953002-Pyramimonas_sp.AAC.1